MSAGTRSPPRKWKRLSPVIRWFFEGQTAASWLMEGQRAGAISLRSTCRDREGGSGFSQRAR